MLKLVDRNLAIVLTGTIVPNVPLTRYNDPVLRRLEYLQAIRFYSRYAPVYFLENSGYPLREDPDFNRLPNVFLRQMPISDNPVRGKGYQEFEMLDRWLVSDPFPPSRWFKITGRYIYRNTAELLKSSHNDRHVQLIIDQCRRTSMARSYLFCVTTEFYLSQLRSLYQMCDDRTGEWIEKILFRELGKFPSPQVALFSIEPDQTGVSGATGESLERSRVNFYLKKLLRHLNRLLDSKYLLYAR